MRPDLYHGIVAQVAVDVGNVLDDTIPLTTFESTTVGTTLEQAGRLQYMLVLPYDQVEKKAYPSLLVTTGLHDSSECSIGSPPNGCAARWKTTRTGADATNSTSHGGARRPQALRRNREVSFMIDLAGSQID